MIELRREDQNELDWFGISCGHLCASCVNRPKNGRTDGDENDCDYARMAFEEPIEGYVGKDGNDRKCKNIETVDNGGGYYIVRCGNYERIHSLYYRYLHSEDWKWKKAKALKRAEYRCSLCGTGKNLEVHHITYKNLFNEDDDDLLAVCENCHKKIHDKDLQSEDM